jgi:hypothetical protein
VFHSLDQRFLYTAHKIVVTFNDYGLPKTGQGTCFFVDRADGRVALVTNRHVLDAGYKNRAKSHWTISRVRISGFLPPDFRNFECTVLLEPATFPTSQLEDVAAATVIKTIEGSWLGHVNYGVQNIPREMLLSEDDFSQLFLADIVLFPGFPGWHDQLEGRPIMRRGSLSSDPKHNYLGPGMQVGGRVLAYEAFSFGGSSGSPVFLAPFGVRLNDEQPGNYRPPKLIGVNGGHLLTRDGNRHHSGISYFFRSTIISELLQ